jgi:hypothetical protein
MPALTGTEEAYALAHYDQALRDFEKANERGAYDTGRVAIAHHALGMWCAWRLWRVLIGMMSGTGMRSGFERN